MWESFEISVRKLYMAYIDHNAPSMEHRSLVIATAHPLPIGEAIEIPLYDTQHTTAVTVTSCVKRLRFTEAQLSYGAQFTSRLLRAILNRPLERRDDQLSYVILPLKNGGPHDTSSIRRLKHGDIAWDEVAASLGVLHRPFDIDDLTRDARDAMTTTPAELSGRWYVSALEGESTEACLTLEAASTARAHLSPLASPKDPVQSQRHVTQCLRYAIHASVFRAALFLPSILIVIGDYHTAFDLNNDCFGGQMDIHKLCQALTCPSAQRSRDYQRLEYLGDVMLKTIVSIAVFVDGPTRKESELNSVRSSIVNNSALAKASRAFGLEKYLIHRPLRIKEYVHVGFKLESHTEPATQEIPLKRLADVMEAIIGVASQDGANISAAYAKAMELGVNLPRTSWLATAGNTEGEDAAAAASSAQIALGHAFRDPKLIQTALSLADWSSKQRQRFEFLGDAILDYFVATCLYRRHPIASEGELSKLKEAAVNNETLSAFCVHTKLHAEIHGIAQENLRTPIELYSSAVEKASSGSPSLYWKRLTGPKALADTVEAVLGAILVDSDFNFAPSQAVFNSLFLPFLDQYVWNHTREEPPRKKRKL